MRKIMTHRLKPGMKLGRTLINANRQVLLVEGTILNQRLIKKLSQLGIPSVYIDDGFLNDVRVNDVISEETRYQAIDLSKKVFQDFRYTRCLTGLDKMEYLIDSIIEELLNNNKIMVNLVDIRILDEYTFGHSVNTCILSLITAVHMGYGQKRLRRLAMGAIMHDLGKTLIPTEVLCKPGKLTPEEFSRIKTHSELGYNLLTANRDFHPLSAVAVLQHHERFNGTGYPQGLIGDQIHEFSAIVGIADVYDALTADRVYRKAHSPREAFEMLAASGDFLFGYDVVRSFLYHVAAYPVGSLVRLNSGETGVVLENRPGHSLRPKVKVLFNEANEPVNPYEVDLASAKDLTITIIVEDDAELGQLRVQKCD